MAENKLHVRGHYSEKEINDKLGWAISLLHELVVSIDDIEGGYTLGKADRINSALANARTALGLPAPSHGADTSAPQPAADHGCGRGARCRCIGWEIGVCPHLQDARRRAAVAGVTEVPRG